MRLVSIGTSCISGIQIKYIHKQRGLVSPFTWTLSTIENINTAIESNFNTLLDRDNYISYTIINSQNKRQLVIQSVCGTKFLHCDPLDNKDHYDKLKAQCRYIKECLSQSRDIGYMVTIFHSYEKKRNGLRAIRKVIPKDCKFLVTELNCGINSEPLLNDDNIYVASVDIGDYTKRVDEGGRQYARAQAYGVSPEYTEIVNAVF